MTYNRKMLTVEFRGFYSFKFDYPGREKDPFKKKKNLSMAVNPVLSSWSRRQITKQRVVFLDPLNVITYRRRKGRRDRRRGKIRALVLI